MSTHMSQCLPVCVRVNGMSGVRYSVFNEERYSVGRMDVYVPSTLLMYFSLVLLS